MTGSGCSICLEAFYRPVTCIPCGHVFCRSCIGQWERGQIRGCPHCRVTIRDVQRIIWDDADIYKDCSQSRPGFEELIQDKIISVKQKLAEIRKCLHRDVNFVWRRMLKLLHSQTLRQLPEKARASWEGYGQDMQFLILVITFLFLSLIVQDARNQYGIIQSSLIPLMALLLDITHNLISFLVFLLFRPCIAIGHIALEIIFMFFDAGFCLGGTTLAIAWDVISIPIVIVRAFLVWVVLLAQFSAELLVTMIRFFFVVVLCTVLLLVFRPDPHFQAHLRNRLNNVLNFYREFRRKIEAQ